MAGLHERVQRAVDTEFAGGFENVRAVPCSEFARDAAFLRIREREFRLLPQVFARRKRTAASLEAMRSVRRSPTGRGAGPSVCSQDIFAGAKGRYGGHDETDRRRDGGKDRATFVDERDDETASDG